MNNPIIQIMTAASLVIGLYISLTPSFYALILRDTVHYVASYRPGFWRCLGAFVLSFVAIWTVGPFVGFILSQFGRALPGLPLVIFCGTQFVLSALVWRLMFKDPATGTRIAFSHALVIQLIMVLFQAVVVLSLILILLALGSAAVNSVLHQLQLM